jgi:hypothetical protein
MTHDRRALVLCIVVLSFFRTLVHPCSHISLKVYYPHANRLKPWINQYIQSVKSLFSSRLLFIGLQGSYGRDEADENSDIDMWLSLTLDNR